MQQPGSAARQSADESPVYARIIQEAHHARALTIRAAARKLLDLPRTMRNRRQ